MDRNQFKLIHSELIQQVQCIERNLKIIYAAMHKGNFISNLKSVEKMNLGKIEIELEKLKSCGILLIQIFYIEIATDHKT